MKVALVTVFALLALVPSSASADDAAVAEAKKLLLEGKDLYDAHKWDEAHTRYAAAYALVPTPNTLRGLAMSELRSGRVLESCSHFDELLSDVQGAASLDPELLANMRKNGKEACDYLGRIEVRAPAGSWLRIDGSEVGRTPLSHRLVVQPGEHLIEADVNCTHQQVKASVSAGAIVTVPIEPPASVQPAITPPSIPPEPVSRRQPPPSSVEVQPASFWTVPRIAGVVAIGVGALSFGAAWISRSQRDQSLDDARSVLSSVGSAGCTGVPSPACSSLADRYSEAQGAYSRGQAFLGIGVASMVAGGVLLLWPAPHGRSRAALTPTVTMSSAGLTFQGGM